MKLTKYLYTALATLAFASCSDDQITLEWGSDPTAVNISASLTDGTRTTPAGTPDEQAAFSNGDVIKVSNGTTAADYTFNGTSWVPVDQSKYLRWETDQMDVTAYYPVRTGASISGCDVPTDQTTLEKLASADYMKAEQNVTKTDDKTLNLQMKRQMSLVNVTVIKIHQEVGSKPQLRGMKFYDASNHAVDAYKHNGADVFTAIVNPDDVRPEKFFDVTVAVDGSKTVTRTAKGWPADMKPGMSYNLKVIVGSDIVNVESVSLEPWTDKNYSGVCYGAEPNGNEIWVKSTQKPVKTSFNQDMQFTISETANEFGYYVYKFTSKLTEIPSKLFAAADQADSNPSNANQYITEVQMPRSVTKIGREAFVHCVNLTKVNLPEGLTTIGRYSFYKCKKLESVDLPSGLTTLDYDAFNDCNSITSVVIPTSLKRIGSSAFRSCENLSSVTFHDNIEYIGGSAFEYCRKLSSVTLPKGLTSIGAWAFNGCTAMKTLTFPSDIRLTVTSYRTFSSTGIEEVVIPEGVKFADGASYTFAECADLKKVTINTSQFGTRVHCFFGDTPRLKTVKITANIASSVIQELFNINFNGNPVRYRDNTDLNVQISKGNPNGISGYTWCSTEWGSVGYYDIPEDEIWVRTNNSQPVQWSTEHLNKYPEKSYTCSSSTNTQGFYVIKNNPGNFDSVPVDFFREVKNVEHVMLPERVKTLESRAFGGASALKYVNLPQTLTTIKEYAFHWCGYDNSSISRICMPLSLTRIEGAKVFGDLKGLKKIVFPENVRFSISDGEKNILWGTDVVEEVFMGPANYDGTSIIRGYVQKVKFLSDKAPTQSQLTNMLELPERTSNYELYLNTYVDVQPSGNTWNGYTWGRIIKFRPNGEIIQ